MIFLLAARLADAMRALHVIGPAPGAADIARRRSPLHRPAPKGSRRANAQRSSPPPVKAPKRVKHEPKSR